MRIATLNLWGRFGDLDARLECLASTWSQVAADVLFCQEVADDRVVAALRDIGGFSHILQAPGAGEHVLIAARQPLHAAQIVPLASSQPPRTAVVARCGAVHVVCAHTAFRPPRMVQQHLHEVMRLARHPCVLGGDLNAEPDVVMPLAHAAGLHDPHVDLAHTWPIDEAYFTHAWAAHTGRVVDFPVAPRRLDYLLTSRSLPVHASGSQELRVGTVPASDHACVWIDV